MQYPDCLIKAKESKVLEQDLSVSDVSDMDELDQPLHVVMNRLSREYADAEIL